MRRESGFYWVELVGGKRTIALWTNIFRPRRGSEGPARSSWGGNWTYPPGAYPSSPRVRKVLSTRLVPPGKGIPLPLERVLLEESGKTYREALRILRVNLATGSVIVARGKS